MLLLEFSARLKVGEKEQIQEEAGFLFWCPRRLCVWGALKDEKKDMVLSQFE